MGVLGEAYYLGLLAWRNLFPKGDWKAENVPDLRGRVVLVTGMVARPPVEYSSLTVEHAG